MKKISLGLFALIFAACSQPNPNNNNNNLTNTNPNPPANNVQTPSVPKGIATVIKGSIKGLTSDKIFLDKKTADANEIIASTALNPDGSFTLNTHIAEAGIYRLRAGLSAFYLILNGGESLDLQAAVSGENVQSLQINGSETANELSKWQLANQATEKNIVAFLTKTPSTNPFVNYFLLEKLPLEKHLSLAEKVYNELSQTAPNSANTLALNAKITTAKITLNTPTQAQGEVAIGKVPPDIQLKNPDGKTMSLRSLKGKVVLLDFWASWCGPCRRENPNVVRVYEQYKDKGFTVFSVSLDGLDDGRIMSMQGNTELINQQLEAHRQKWINAIAQDKLSWPNHVSDLRGWSCAPAVAYAVQGIPRTFLLNRAGQIVAMDLRGPALEEAVKKYLN